MARENADDEAPWWFKVIVLGATTLVVIGASRVLDTWSDDARTDKFCAALSDLGHYTTKVEAGRCWIKLGDGEYDSRWVPAEWMNVG